MPTSPSPAEPPRSRLFELVDAALGELARAFDLRVVERRADRLGANVVLANHAAGLDISLDNLEGAIDVTLLRLRDGRVPSRLDDEDRLGFVPFLKHVAPGTVAPSIDPDDPDGEEKALAAYARLIADHAGQVLQGDFRAFDEARRAFEASLRPLDPDPAKTPPFPPGSEAPAGFIGRALRAFAPLAEQGVRLAGTNEREGEAVVLLAGDGAGVEIRRDARNAMLSVELVRLAGGAPPARDDLAGRVDARYVAEVAGQPLDAPSLVSSEAEEDEALRRYAELLRGRAGDVLAGDLVLLDAARARRRALGHENRIDG